MNLWKPVITPIIIGNLFEIKKKLYDQTKFSKQSLELINKIKKFCEKKEDFDKKKDEVQKERKNRKEIKSKYLEKNNSFFSSKGTKSTCN